MLLLMHGNVSSHKSNGLFKERKQKARVISEVLLVRSLNIEFPGPCSAVDTLRAFAKVSGATEPGPNELACLLIRGEIPRFRLNTYLHMLNLESHFLCWYCARLCRMLSTLIGCVSQVFHSEVWSFGYDVLTRALFFARTRQA